LEAQLEMQDENPFKPVVSVKWFTELNNLNKLLKDYIEIKLPDIPVLMMTGKEDRIIDAQVAVQWLYGQKFSNFQYKEWKHAKHSLFFELERDEVFYLTRDFMYNNLRSIGYII
ncbi:MAG: alpha/beta hydrolase, partial [Lysinibacillus sp.]